MVHEFGWGLLLQQKSKARMWEGVEGGGSEGGATELEGESA